jgi:hypothetical protein
VRYGRDGQPRRDGLLQALEIDAVALLRAEGQHGRAMRDRLNARAYLLGQGWTVAEINAAAEAGGIVPPATEGERA